MLYPTHGKQFAQSGAGTNAGVTVTVAGEASKRHGVAAIQCSGDAAALVTIESPSGNIIYRKRFAGAFNMSEHFTQLLFGASGEDVLVKISASTANCEANIQGQTING